MADGAKEQRKLRQILGRIRAMIDTKEARKIFLDRIGTAYVHFLAQMAGLRKKLFYTENGYLQTDLSDPWVMQSIPISFSPAILDFLREREFLLEEIPREAHFVQPRTPADAFLFHFLLLNILQKGERNPEYAQRIASPLTELCSFHIWEGQTADFSCLFSPASWFLVEDYVLRCWLDIEEVKLESEPEEALVISQRQNRIFHLLRKEFREDPGRLPIFMRFYRSLLLIRSAEHLSSLYEYFLQHLKRKKQARLAEMQEERCVFGNVFGVPFWTGNGLKSFSEVQQNLLSTPPYLRGVLEERFLEEYEQFSSVEPEMRRLYEQFCQVFV